MDYYLTCNAKLILLKSSDLVGRPYSDYSFLCFLSQSYEIVVFSTVYNYLFPFFCQGDISEMTRWVYRVKVIYNVFRFLYSLQKHLRS